MMDIAFPYFSLFRYRSLVLLVNAMKWYSESITARGSLWLKYIFHAFFLPCLVSLGKGEIQNRRLELAMFV